MRAAAIVLTACLAPACHGEIGDAGPLAERGSVSYASAGGGGATASTSVSSAASGGGGAAAGPTSASTSVSTAAASTSSGGACVTTTSDPPIQPGEHVATCSVITWTSDPPCSGAHYKDWAQFKTTYDKPVPRGFWVHDLEHGAIVVVYNCPDGCDADVGTLRAFLDALPQDPACSPTVKHKILLTPDAELDVRFAAAAWGHLLESDCVDLDALGAFYAAHYDHGGESVCDDGYDVTTDSGIPPDCGK